MDSPWVVLGNSSGFLQRGYECEFLGDHVEQR